MLVKGGTGVKMHKIITSHVVTCSNWNAILVYFVSNNRPRGQEFTDLQVSVLFLMLVSNIMKYRGWKKHECKFEYQVISHKTRHLLEHIEAETKWPPFSRRHFKMHFLEWKNKNFDSIPKGPINNILALVQIMAWRRPGDKPLSEPVIL